MRLNRASDFALRILMLLVRRDNALSVDEISETLSLPKSHVMKIVARLAHAGILSTQRGRGGGVKLACDPNQLRVGGSRAAQSKENSPLSTVLVRSGQDVRLSQDVR